jgi:hypothetical protein
MGQAQVSNYANIEVALGQLLTNYTGAPVELGDFSKITLSSPSFVIQHARLKSPDADRKPQFEDLHWIFPVHMFFDYQSDVEAHQLIRDYRLVIIQALMEHPQLDVTIANASYPTGIPGHALDSKVISGDLTGYFSLDQKQYALSTYEVWVHERVAVNRAAASSH